MQPWRKAIAPSMLPLDVIGVGNRTARFPRNVWILTALLVAEAILYWGFFQREVSWFPPDGYDQAVYLSKAYQLQESLGAFGLKALWGALKSPDHSNSLLLPIEGGLFGSVFGGSRLPALILNYVAFAVAQVATFAAIRRATNSRSWGYIAVGLLLLECTTWNWVGGLFDFRFDFVALCLYGTWAAAVVRSDIYLDRTWSVVSGAVAAILVLHRFLTAVYVIGVAAGLLAVVAALSRRRVSAKRRASNLGISLVIAVAPFVPVVLRNWDSIHAYYVVADLTGDETAIRAAMAGVFTLYDNLIYYPNVALKYHLGYAFAIAVVCLLAISLGLRLVLGPGERKPPVPSLLVVFLVGAAVGPLVALTLVPSKASQIAGIVGIPMAMLSAVAGFALSPRPARSCARVMAAAFLAAGALYQLDQGVRNSPLVEADHGELRQWNNLVSWLTSYALDHRLKSPTLSTDITSSRLFAPAIMAGGYEFERALVPWRQLLGGGIFPVDRQKALELLAASDVVVLSSVPKSEAFPFHVALKPYWAGAEALDRRQHDACPDLQVRRWPRLGLRPSLTARQRLVSCSVISARL